MRTEIKIALTAKYMLSFFQKLVIVQEKLLQNEIVKEKLKDAICVCLISISDILSDN
jgi:hypothetical protein